MSASVVLGVVTTVRWKTPRWPLFVTAGLHRNISLLVPGGQIGTFNPTAIVPGGLNY